MLGSVLGSSFGEAGRRRHNRDPAAHHVPWDSSADDRWHGHVFKRAETTSSCEAVDRIVNGRTSQ